MSQYLNAGLETCRRRFEDLASRYPRLAICVVQRESGPPIKPLPKLVTSGLQWEEPCYLCTIEEGGRWGWRTIFVYGDDRAALGPLSATMADVGRYLTSRTLPPWVKKELSSSDRDETRWLHVLLAVCWRAGIGGINAAKSVQVQTREVLLVVTLDDLPRCRREADTAPHLSIIPDPPNWFTCSVVDLAGTSVAAINWLLLENCVTAPSRDYIDLDQAAALVNRSKRTLERQLKRMPLPEIQGAGGRKSEWLYSTLRPWLEKEFGKPLPERPPHAVR